MNSCSDITTVFGTRLQPSDLYDVRTDVKNFLQLAPLHLRRREKVPATCSSRFCTPITVSSSSTRTSGQIHLPRQTVCEQSSSELIVPNYPHERMKFVPVPLTVDLQLQRLSITLREGEKGHSCSLVHNSIQNVILTIY